MDCGSLIYILQVEETVFTRWFHYNQFKDRPHVHVHLRPSVRRRKQFDDVGIETEFPPSSMIFGRVPIIIMIIFDRLYAERNQTIALFSWVRVLCIVRHVLSPICNMLLLLLQVGKTRGDKKLSGNGTL